MSILVQEIVSVLPLLDPPLLTDESPFISCPSVLPFIPCSLYHRKAQLALDAISLLQSVAGNPETCLPLLNCMIHPVNECCLFLLIFPLFFSQNSPSSCPLSAHDSHITTLCETETKFAPDLCTARTSLCFSLYESSPILFVFVSILPFTRGWIRLFCSSWLTTRS
jgi:hypothetical protein